MKRLLPRYSSLVVCICVFLALGAYQLQLPGLHYDEAKEAGLNAMQLVTGQPMTAFRDASVQIGPWRLPLMVQDYIGALNPLLAVPFLALAGLDPSTPARSVVALRWLPLIIGAITLLLAWCVARALGGTTAAAVTAGLLAVNPTFVFWSRQGIFVTNLTALFFMAALLTGLRWWHVARRRDLWLTALFCGLGLYSKLLFAWAIGAMAIVVLAASVWRRARRGPRATRHADHAPAVGAPQLRPPESDASLLMTRLSCWAPYLIAMLFFLLPLVPLILFNLRTNGTVISIFGNLGHSYYGVNNRAYLSNLLKRIGEIGGLLRGDFFWYLGEQIGDSWSTSIAAGLLVSASLVAVWEGARSSRAHVPRANGQNNRPGGLAAAHWLPVVLLVLIVAQSAFTVSDLFITHYVLLLPLIPLSAGLAAAYLWRAAWRTRPWLRVLLVMPVLAAVVGWAAADLQATLRYHETLGISGGYSAHSDAITSLAAYLARTGPSAPLALDWGLDAPVRFLTVGHVNPIEVFGYASMDKPDGGFDERIVSFLANPDNVYLAHPSDQTIFKGRVEALTMLAAKHGLAISVEALFRERNGRPVYMVLRVMPAKAG